MIRNGKRITPVILFCLLLCCTALAAEDKSSPTQEPASLHDRPIRTDVEMVLVSVSVVDPVSDRVVTGLTKENFEVLEDKQPQQVSQFSTEDVPISVCVVFDVSGSMVDKIDKSQLALAQFFRLANPNDEFSLISFSDRPEKLSGFTHDPRVLESKIGFAQPHGRTALLDAVYLGLNEMRKASQPRKVMLAISDGGDNHSRYTVRDIRKAIKEADVQIYAIGIYESPERRGRTPEELAGPSMLGEITGMTGGREFEIQNVNDLPAAAKKIGHEMRNLYVLGYSPANTKHDGKWRKIQVKLHLPKGLSRLLLFNKAGYYAPGR